MLLKSVDAVMFVSLKVLFPYELKLKLPFKGFTLKFFERLKEGKTY